MDPWTHNNNNKPNPPPRTIAGTTEEDMKIISVGSEHHHISGTTEEENRYFCMEGKPKHHHTPLQGQQRWTGGFRRKKLGGTLFSMERGALLAFDHGEFSSGKVIGKLNRIFFLTQKTYFYRNLLRKIIKKKKFHTGNGMKLISGNCLKKIIFPDLFSLEDF